MRPAAFLPAFTAAAVLLVGSTALAAPASVTVAVSPALQEKARKTYGTREVAELAERLRQTVETRAARSPALDGARIELVLDDAIPSKPTRKQLDDTPGLSYFWSKGAGGAAITGQVTRADGQVTPVSYKWYETLHSARTESTWGDATGVFERFAGNLSKGRQIARR